MKAWWGSKSTSVDTIMKNIANGMLLTADLQDGYNFPYHIVCTDLFPDIVWWDDGKSPFDTLLEEAALRKKVKYAELVESIKRAGYRCNLITIEVGSRGLINLPGFSKLNDHFYFPKKTMKELAFVCNLQTCHFRLLQSVV